MPKLGLQGYLHRIKEHGIMEQSTSKWHMWQLQRRKIKQSDLIFATGTKSYKILES